MVNIGFRTDRIDIFARVAAGSTEHQLLFSQDVHSFHDSLIGTVATAKISGLFKAFHAERWHKILYPQHFISKLFVNQRAVGKC